MLRVARQLADDNGVELSATLLSAHATPPEYQGDADGYISLVCETILPTLWQEGLFESVDVFCEKRRLQSTANRARISGRAGAGHSGKRPR